MTENLEQAAEEFLTLLDRLRQMGPQTAPPREANISLSQLAILSFSSSNPGCGIQVMASGLKLSKPSISVSVTQLEEAGFLVREPDPQDGRAIRLFLTPEGRKLHQRTFDFRCQKFQRLLKYLTAQERKTLNMLLDKALNLVEKETKGESN